MIYMGPRIAGLAVNKFCVAAENVLHFPLPLTANLPGVASATKNNDSAAG